MKIKSGVIMPDKLVMRIVLIGANIVWNQYKRELVITCGKDGTHSAGSLHYYGYAVDLRTRFWMKKKKRTVFELLQKRLGSDYRIIWHRTHIHVECRKILTEVQNGFKERVTEIYS